MIKNVFKPSRRKNGKRVRSRIYWGQYRLDPADKIKRVSLGTTDKRVAEKKLDDLVRQVQLEQEGLVQSPTRREAAQRPLAEQLDEFVRDLTTRGRARQYIRHVENRCRRVLGDCSWELIKDVKPGDFLEWRSEQSISPRTLNHYLDSVTVFFNWLRDVDRIERNPLDRIQKVETRGMQTIERRAFSDSELESLFKVSGPRRAVYVAAVSTGLRHKELRELKWGDVHLDDDQPHIRLRAASAKNRRASTIMLTDEVAEEFHRIQPVRHDPTALVFARGMPSHHTFNRDLERAGIRKKDESGRKVDFHALRHTLATNLARSGVPQRVAMEIMRHSDPKLTANVYTDGSALPVRAALDQMEAVVRIPREQPGRQKDAQLHAQRLDADAPDPSRRVTTKRQSQSPQMPLWQEDGRESACDDTPRHSPNKEWSRGESNPRTETVSTTPLRVCPLI